MVQRSSAQRPVQGRPTSQRTAHYAAQTVSGRPSARPPKKRRSLAVPILTVLVLFSLGLNFFILWQLYRAKVLVDQGVEQAMQTVQSLTTQTFEVPVHVEQDFPINVTVPFRYQDSIPINTEIPIDVEISVPFNIMGQTINLRFPVQTTVPVNLDVPVDIQMNVPISTVIPLELDLVAAVPLSQTILPQYVQQFEAMMAEIQP